MKRMKKQVKKEPSFLFTFICIFSGFVLAGILFFFVPPTSTTDKLVLPSNTQGIIYSIDDNQAIIKLDLKDPNAKLLLHDIETVCDGYKIKSCMSIFGGKLKPMTSQAMVSQGQVCPAK